MIAVVCSTDRGYLPAACCQIASVSDHLGGREDVAQFLVCCDVDDEDVAEAERFFAAREVTVEIVVLCELADEIYVLDGRWTRAAYLRLYFDWLFSREFDRLVYFDADTRILTDVGSLIDADLDGNPAGAVHDFIYYVTGNIRRRRHDLFLSPDAPYLQSGVMVFDWPAMLDADVLGQARDFLLEHGDRCLEAPDQDALNVALEGRWTPLDPRWNLHELSLAFGGRQRPFIEHYTSTKPWSRERPRMWNDAAAWYERELRGTPWEGFVERQSSIDVLRARARFLLFRAAPKIRHLFGHDAVFVPDAVDEVESAPVEGVLPWAPRNRRIVEVMTDALIDEAACRCPRILPPESALVAAGKTG